MKFITLLPLAAITTAFVIPDEAITHQIVAESQESSKTFLDRLPSKDDIFAHVEETFKDGVAFGGNALDNAIAAATDVGKKAKSSFQCHSSMTAFDGQSWLDSAVDAVEDLDLFEHPKHPHHRPHHKKPHHHHKPNMTIYELINSSKYTTKLAKLINEYDDLIDILNGTTANYTVFAPTDKAFEKIPKHHKKPDKELIRNILAYHVSPDFYPAGRVLVTHTLPTTYHEEGLGGEPQRLRLGLSLKGLTVNFYSKVVAVNIFGTNGVIHGVDSLLLPPPQAVKIISLLPGEFSTLELALTKTGLGEVLAKGPHTGGTLFAPSNFAFRKLGPKINAFLFSSYGEKYLKALLKYHVVANQTLYSDAFYGAKDAEKGVEGETIPKGLFHVDLPTLLKDKSLSIDVGRYGGLINIRINGYTDVAVQDGLARDGVIHIPRSVLIPPKTPGGVMYQGEDLTVEDLKERLEDLVEDEAEQKGWFEL